MADTWEIWPPAAPEITYPSDAVSTDLLDKFLGSLAHVDVPKKPKAPLTDQQKQTVMIGAVFVLGTAAVYFSTR